MRPADLRASFPPESHHLNGMDKCISPKSMASPQPKCPMTSEMWEMELAMTSYSAYGMLARGCAAPLACCNIIVYVATLSRFSPSLTPSLRSVYSTSVTSAWKQSYHCWISWTSGYRSRRTCNDCAGPPRSFYVTSCQRSEGRYWTISYQR